MKRLLLLALTAGLFSPIAAKALKTEERFETGREGLSSSVLTCHLHQRLIPHGDHLTSKCQCWMQRLERKIGWCPEAA